MKYWVDWEDQFYPKIRPMTEATEREIPLTVKEAKQEIIDHAKHIIEHWRLISKQTRELRARDINKGQ